MTSLSQDKREALGYNPNRTIDLFALTLEGGYIIAQDIACQHEYILLQTCPDCSQNLMPIAQINRAFQGLNEVVAVCPEGAHFSFIFDISNEVYQEWWIDQIGFEYVNPFDIPPRQPDPARRYFQDSC